MSNEKIGVLLTNIGTPDSYEVKDVKKYLKTFLMDEDIINIPFLLRWFLVHCIIVPSRARYSAENYKKVWTPDGSPLAVFSQSFKNKLQEELGKSYVVEFGMSYSQPTIEQALSKMANTGVTRIIVAPMYPQFAQATTGSAVKSVQKAIAKLKIKAPIQLIADFYDQPAFIESQAKIAQEFIPLAEIDHIVFSYHGLPESQIKKDKLCKLDDSCCELESSCARRCYRAQCLKTSKKLAATLNIPRDKWTMTFQSRLGKTEWIKPYTDKTVAEISQKSVKKLGMISPAFVTDCIETLEELNMGIRETFEEHGGSEFYLSPCVNDDDVWVKGFAQLLKTY